MAIPVANFTYLISDLTVDFTDKSVNNPTSWNWDFGDTETSSSQNPTHTYSVPDTYTVILTATNGDGTSPEFTRDITVAIPTTLYVEDFINADLPEGLSIEATSQSLWIKKWQLHLQTLLEPKISTPDVHNDSAWPNLANALIAKLVIHDAFTRAATGAMVLVMQAGSGSSESSSDSVGSEKTIETGPTKVEWHDASEMVSSLMSKGTGEDGQSIFDILRQEICRLASRLRIKLPLCDQLPHSPIIPIKATFRQTPPRHPLSDYSE